MPPSVQHFDLIKTQPLFPADAMPRRWLAGGMAILDRAGVILQINSALADWLHRPAKELFGQPLWPWLEERFPNDRPALEECRLHGKTFPKTTLQTAASDQSPAQWFEIELAQHDTGSFVRLASILPPLAELEETSWDDHLRSSGARREMFARLIRAEAQLENLTHRWPGVLFSQRPDFSFLFVSPKIESLTGISVAEWQRHPNLFWELLHESDREELQHQLKALAQSPQGITCTFRIRHAVTSRITYVLEHRQAITSPNGLVLGYEGVWVDVTRQTMAEKRLSSAAWKETLAHLTMGLAHDFTNVLAGIHSLSESFLAHTPPEHPFNEGLSLIRRSALQATQLVHRIINLHRGKTGESNYFNLNELVAGLTDLIRKIVPRRIEFRTELCGASLPVFIDAFEFQQVILNMVLNAVDAMPQTGQLVLRTAAHADPPPGVKLDAGALQFPAASLSIQDSGCGIKARHLPNIFDPFFTTKAMNKGSGLGLYNARTFVEKHRGAITVETAEGLGTTFYLWFPQTDFSETESVAPAAASATKRLSLLVAGPPGDTVEATAEFLRSHHYHVVTAISPENALSLSESREYEFAGVILLVEPDDRNFASIIPQLRQAKPSIKIILKPLSQRDELDSPLLAATDLIISPDLSEAGILEKLHSTLFNFLTQ